MSGPLVIYAVCLIRGFECDYRVGLTPEEGEELFHGITQDCREQGVLCQVTLNRMVLRDFPVEQLAIALLERRGFIGTATLIAEWDSVSDAVKTLDTPKDIR